MTELLIWVIGALWGLIVLLGGVMFSRLFGMLDRFGETLAEVSTEVTRLKTLWEIHR